MVWPFSRRGVSAVASRVTESVASQREKWLRDDPSADLGGAALSDGQRAAAVKKSRVEYLKAPVYGGVADRFLDFVMGDGVTIEAEDDSVDAWLQDQLKRAKFHERLRTDVKDLFVDGERLKTVTALERVPGTPIGNLRIGALDPLGIRTVHVNTLDADDLVRLTYQGAAGKDFQIPLVREDAKPEPAPAKEGERAGQFIGVLWQVNRSGARGAPLLLRTLDHASDLDNLVGNLVAQLEYVRRLWLKASVTQTDDRESAGKASKFKALIEEIKGWASSWKPGEILVHSGGPDGIKIDSFAPKFELADAKALYDIVLEMCLGGHGIPRFWFGSANDASRTSAAEQGTPIFRAITAAQTEVRGCLESLVRAMLIMGEAAGVPGVKADSKFTVTMSTVATRDSERDVREVAALGATLQIAVDRGALSDEEAGQILRKVIQGKPWGKIVEGDALPEPKAPVAPPFPPPQQQPPGAPPKGEQGQPERPPLKSAA